MCKKKIEMDISKKVNCLECQDGLWKCIKYFNLHINYKNNTQKTHCNIFHTYDISAFFYWLHRSS